MIVVTNIIRYVSVGKLKKNEIFCYKDEAKVSINCMKAFVLRL